MFSDKILYILVGIPGCGKSTWAARKKTEMLGLCEWVSRDKIRFSFLSEGEDYFAHEEEVFDLYVEDIQNAINDNIPYVIADATHLTHKSRQQLLNRVYTRGHKIVYVYFDVPLATALERNAGRSGRANVPKQAILRMYNALTKPRDGITIIVDENGNEVKSE